MKGFTKDGKFRPTEKRNKSGLKKSTLPVRDGGRTVELTGADAEEYIKKRFPDYDLNKLPKNLRAKRNEQSIDDERKIQERPYSQVAIWGSTTVGKDKTKEFEDFMKSEYGVRVKYLEEIKTFPDRDQNGSNVEGTGGRNDVFFSVHEDDIPKFAVKRLGMDPPVRWIEDVIANQSEPLTIYPESVKEYRTWET